MRGTLWTGVETMRLIDADALDEALSDAIITQAFDAQEYVADAPTLDAVPVRHLHRSDVYEPFYQWLGLPSSSNSWDELRSMIDDLVDACGAKMDKEDTNENA